MLNQCSWCQSDIDFPEEVKFLHQKTPNYLCAECIIPLLPNSLSVEEDELFDEEKENDEQRNAIRLPMLSRVYLSPADHTSRVTKVLLLNFSSTGFKIQTQEPVNLDEKLTLGFLGKKISYKVIGTVVHIEKTNLNDQDYYEIGSKLTGIHMELR